jgi:hypothetical protein
MKRPKLMLALAVVAILAVVVLALGKGWLGDRLGAGDISNTRRPLSFQNALTKAQHEAAVGIGGSQTGAEPIAPMKQILFGDLHVHTTFSLDAFMTSLPVMNGEGAHPPADACDFARFCSALDFWALTDHAEGMTPWQWKETKKAVRQCNAVSGDPKDPDLVTFVGWEWTQSGTIPANHYGHKNVIFKDTEEERLPVRPIASRSPQGAPSCRAHLGADFWQRVGISLAAPGGNRSYYLDFTRFHADRFANRACPENGDVHSLPADCYESVATPAKLFAKLDQWGFESMVIPHGTTWGNYTPGGSSWDKQLIGNQHDPKRQYVFEVYSGHGNSEEYRPWRALNYDKENKPSCPDKGDDFLPSCFRAGEIIEARCLKEGLPAAECKKRAAQARQNYADLGNAGHLTIPGATIHDWKDANQCRDCYLPAFNYRPGGSAQYALALTNFDDAMKPKQFRFGFISSSDNHFARPGTGFKEVSRRGNTESSWVMDADVKKWLPEPEPRPLAKSIPFDRNDTKFDPVQYVEMERLSSFFTTGGLAAVHAKGRSREEIWQAFERREIYATSGERMLIWFDLLNAPGGTSKPMGAAVTLAEAPRFQVRAVGAFKQKPGCPQYSQTALGPKRLARLCKNECYNPSNERKLIERIDIIRIRPQTKAGEDVAQLIQDPWKTFKCPPNANGCSVTFTDPEFPAQGRPATYYARAIQEPAKMINADNLRCTRDANGDCKSIKPCTKIEGVPLEDDCLANKDSRAWTSPIYVSPAR